MKNKELIYATAFAEVKKFGLSNDDTDFLANMVLRKIRHPEEKMDKIAMKVMQKISKKHRKLAISASKCLEHLHEELDMSDQVPEEWKSGKVVSRFVKKIAGIVIETLDDEE